MQNMIQIESPYPSGPSGMVSDDGGILFVFDTMNRAVYEMEILESEEGSGQYEFTSRLLYRIEPDIDGSDFLFDLSSYYYFTRSLELTDRGTLHVGTVGRLEEYPLFSGVNPVPGPLESTPLVIQGIPAITLCMATHPLTGEVYLSTFPQTFLGEYFIYLPRRLQILDREAGPDSELGIPDLVITFTGENSNSNPGYFYDLLTSMTISDSGIMYALPVLNNIILIVDLKTGESRIFSDLSDIVSAGEEFNYNHLSYNPEDGRLYFLGKIYDQNEDRTRHALVSLPEAGEGERVVTFIDAGEDSRFSLAAGFVYGGNGKFLVSEPDVPTERREYLYGEVPYNIWEVSINGKVALKTRGAGPIHGLALPGSPPRPDILIGSHPKRLVGDNRYESKGEGQTVRVRRATGQLSGRYYARIENDGLASGSFLVTGAGGKRSDRIRYMEGRENVTAEIRKGYLTTMAAGSDRAMMVSYSRRSGTRWKEKFRLSATNSIRIDAGNVISDLRALPAGDGRPTRIE